MPQFTNLLREECAVCKRVAVEKSRFRMGATTVIELQCGHILLKEATETSDTVYDSIVFSDGAKPRKYQIDAMKFAEDSGFRCIIADEQGLGKTIEAFSLLRIHPERLLPAIVVCPATIKLQMMYELYRICTDGKLGFKDPRFLTQIIKTGKEYAMPGFQVYIVTYDILKKDDLFKYVPDGTIKTLIIDECQRIKNHLSDRAKAVQRIAKSVPHVIPMSGTPIKNNAGEYFTALNLVKPLWFTHYQRYIDTYCDAYNDGWGQKVGGLKDPQRFHEDTKDVIIRRTKAEVLKDLPSLERKFYHVELDKKLNKMYAALMDELEEMMYSENGDMMVKIAIMSKMRHITGISKVEECIAFVTEFLLSTDRKITIFVHHQDIALLLETKLNEWCIAGGFGPALNLTSQQDADTRTKTVMQFQNESERRILIASTLAAGEGLNLQFCSDAIMLERQWNPANEEQAEARFHRFGQQNNVSITYMVAIETIDEYFTKLVEIKRGYMLATLDNKEVEWNTQGLMKELSELLLSKGKREWSL